MRPNAAARSEFIAAFCEMAARIERVLAHAPKRTLPVTMYVAGGTALHFYTGARISEDVDAVFSHRVALPENLDVAYRDADGTARLLYFDRQYNDTFGTDARGRARGCRAAVAARYRCKSAGRTPTHAYHLAISKVGRFAEQDRSDIETLARHGLLAMKSFRKRAEEAAAAYVGDVERVQHSIDIACRLIEHAAAKQGQRRTQRSKPTKTRSR
jgi:hypothetical protein